MHDEQTFRIAVVVGSLGLLPVMAYHRIRSQATGEKLDRRQEGFFILLTLRPLGLLLVLGLVAYAVDPMSMAWSAMPLPAWARWSGVGLGVVASLLIVWTLRTLGKNLTDTIVTRRRHTLVTSGPYRWVRHPFYDGTALWILANALAAANAFLLVAGALVLALLVVRSRREEENLAARFGDAYRDYADRTGRFLPRVGAP